jgi:hypothetical protein
MGDLEKWNMGIRNILLSLLSIKSSRKDRIKRILPFSGLQNFKKLKCPSNRKNSLLKTIQSLRKILSP